MGFFEMGKIEGELIFSKSISNSTDSIYESISYQDKFT